MQQVPFGESNSYQVDPGVQITGEADRPAKIYVLLDRDSYSHDRVGCTDHISSARSQRTFPVGCLVSGARQDVQDLEFSYVLYRYHTPAARQRWP